MKLCEVKESFCDARNVSGVLVSPRLLLALKRLVYTYNVYARVYCILRMGTWASRRNALEAGGSMLGVSHIPAAWHYTRPERMCSGNCTYNIFMNNVAQVGGVAYTYDIKCLACKGDDAVCCVMAISKAASQARYKIYAFWSLRLLNIAMWHIFGKSVGAGK